MPARADHETRAQENAKFQLGLEQLECKPKAWQATTLFYAALHLVDAHLAKKSLHPRTHKTRDNYVASLIDFKPIRNDYVKLKGWSIDARYEAGIQINNSVISQARAAYERIAAHIATLP